MNNKRKIINAELHAFAFLGGTQLGPKLSAIKGERKVEMEIVDNVFLSIKFIHPTTKKVSEGLVPLTNVSYVELEEIKDKK